MIRPKYAKVDLNQSELVADMRDIGMVVWVTASLPTPVLDLVAFWRGKIRIIEVKAPGHEQDFTPGELESIAALELVGIKVIVATCLEDILEQW